jgi:type II secretory pathway pseudopilin PulG
MKKFPNKPSWFTLVELIVVITILVILGTIGFVSLQGYSLSARDSVRVENLSNLHKGLTLFNIVSSSYPLPESFVTITASGTDIGYQGFAKDLVWGIAKLSRGATTDPLDPSISTTYSVNASKTKMQLMSFLEDGNSTLAFLPNAYASIGSDYSKRSYLVKWDGLGILLASGSLQPVQESGTGVDIINTTGSFTMYMNKAQQFMGTGVALRAGIAGDGIVWYWNFDELGNLIKDSSWKGNSGVCYYTTGSTTNCGTIWQWPQFINGKIWLAMSWAGLKIAPFGDLKSKNLTISLWLRSTNTGTGYWCH